MVFNLRINNFSLCISILGFIVLSGCGGGSDSSFNSEPATSSETEFLSVIEVERIIAQAVDVSQRLGEKSTIAVSDRVGNILGVYRMYGTSGVVDNGFNVILSTGKGVTGGLEGAAVPEPLAAISKAITGAYLSSSGNAFTTRTASFIVQEHYIPGLINFPSGPLFGVQFSQLPCGDFVGHTDSVSIGPKRSPLGLSADPGGFPLYKNGKVVGGVGVVTRSDGVYSIDLDPIDIDRDMEEIIAQSSTAGFSTPSGIRADKITAGGFTLRFSDSDSLILTSTETDLITASNQVVGELISVPGFKSLSAIEAGTAFGEASSGYQRAPQSHPLSSISAVFLVDELGENRFPPINSSLPTVANGGLTEGEVEQILSSSLNLASTVRAQIRIPIGSGAQVTATIVDVSGKILGMARLSDGPVFGTDVSLQKARTAVFFSKPTDVDIPDEYSNRFDFSTGSAFSARAIGNLHRPFFPDGIIGNSNGPLSTDIAQWSPFNVGLQLDLVAGKIVSVLSGNNPTSCTEQPVGIDNGIQIFPGGVPIFRGDILVGGIGVSGDGVDQDDMISFLGLHRASVISNSGYGNAPASIRADRVSGGETGDLLRYVQCPQSPFVDSDQQKVCDGI
tara:strand:+ start:8120 stop:9976 length:1857 start_codon:yes stop_codon:yes gene_type:complete